MGISSYRSGKFSNGRYDLGPLQALQRSAKLIIHKGHLQPESRGLGLNTVAAPNTRRKLVATCLFSDRFTDFFNVLDQ